MANVETQNWQVLMEYRKTLIKAFLLGEELKKVCGITPPKVVMSEEDAPTTGYRVRLGIEVAR